MSTQTTQLPETPRKIPRRKIAIAFQVMICVALWFLLVSHGLSLLREQRKESWVEPWRGPMVQGRQAADWLEEGDGFTPIELEGTNVLEYYFAVLNQEPPAERPSYWQFEGPGLDSWGRFVRRQRAVFQVVPEYSCAFSGELPRLLDELFERQEYDFSSIWELNRVIMYARCPHIVKVLTAELESKNWRRATLARHFIGSIPRDRINMSRDAAKSAGLWRMEELLLEDPESEEALRHFRALLESAEHDQNLLVEALLMLPALTTNTAQLYREIEQNFLPLLVKQLEGYRPRLRQYDGPYGGNFTDLPTVILPVLAEIGPEAKGAISAIFKYLEADHSAQRLLAGRAFWKITGEKDRYRKIVEEIIREASDGKVLKLTLDAKMPRNYGCPIAGERVITHDFWLAGWQAAAIYAAEVGVDLDRVLPWMKESKDPWGAWGIYKLTGDATLLKKEVANFLNGTIMRKPEELHAIVSFEDFPVEAIDFDLTTSRHSKDFFRRMLAQLLIEKRESK